MTQTNQPPEIPGRFTTLQLPAWGGVLVPYRWMLREPGQQLANDLGLDLDLSREPQPPLPDFMVNTPWIQNVDNQRNMLNGFANGLSAGISLVFFYARRTPLDDGLTNPIVAVGMLEHVGKVDEYPYKGSSHEGRIRSMVWERPFQHSIRRAQDGFVGGVVLPYNEILALAEADPSLDPSQYLAVAPQEAREQFLYGSEHVDHGSAIGALQAVRNSIEKISTLLPGRWVETLDWIDARLSELWKLRGPAPGLGSALCCVQPNAFNGTLFAHALAPQLGEAEDPWPLVCDIFEERKLPPAGAPALTQLQRRRFVHMKTNTPEKFALMQMLSRFELTRDQALAAFEAEFPMDAVRNPYELFQRSRWTEHPIALGVIDRGLFGGAKDHWPLPRDCAVNIDEPDDTRRLLATTIEVLERAAASGDTILRAELVAEKAAGLPLTPPVAIDALTLELLEDDFAPEVEISSADNGTILAQLDRYNETRLIIDRGVKARLKSQPDPSDIDWRRLLDKELDKGVAPVVDPQEQEARREKAEALAQLANHRIAVLVGPAGSGKTTLLKVLLRQKEIVGPHVELLAPTGKARVRLASQTGYASHARTLAQFLLEHERWDPETGVHSFPRVGPTAQVTTCIVDEASMLTEDQLAALVSVLPPSSRIILVGDPQQLPPIGAGRPFVDLVQHLKEAGGGGVGRLRISRRQTSNGDVSSEALDDLQLAALFGDEKSGPGQDEIAGRLGAGLLSDRLKLLEWDTPERLRLRISEALTTEFGCSADDLEATLERSLGGTDDSPAFFNIGAGSAAEDWQILAPHRDLPSGSAELNRHLKRVARSDRLAAARNQTSGWKMIEPRGPDAITYGDKVICLRNHHRNTYTKEEGSRDGYLANGEVGIVVGQTGYKDIRWTNVEFSTQPGRSFGFARRDFSDHASPILELGYAVTIHKAQGSEFGTSFLVLPAGSRLLSRELLYTALTRQRRRIWILHQGPFSGFLRYRSGFYSETVRRSTNLFRTPSPVEVAPPVSSPSSAGRTFLEDKLIHRSRRGELVSSKSEIVIADILHELELKGRLRYTFEKPRLLGGIERWPDFTIEVDAETWFWEHCGMLRIPVYRQRWERKKAAYLAEGITIWSPDNPNGRLIVTEDDELGGLDSKILYELAQSLW